MRIPPGISEADFSSAVESFQQVVGSDWVFIEEEDVGLYDDAYSPLWDEDEAKIASAAIAPASVEEVQAVMRIANEYSIPIYPVSTGRNLGYGGSAPVLSGSVVLDLKRMNRILEVSEEHAYALVEPGVSYFDLYKYIQERGLDLWLDVADPGWGSPMGNALDRGVGYTVDPYRDHFGAHCGMEVVLADGELVRTGMGAMPNAETWQQFRYGFGPYLDGIFAQSNYGVVTKMGFWLYPAPEAYRSGNIQAMRYEDVHEMVKVSSRMTYEGIMRSMTGLFSPIQFAFRQNPELQERYDRANPDDIEVLNEFARSTNTPFWTCQMKYYGPKEVIDAQWSYTKRQFSHIEGVQYQDGEYFTFPLTEEQIIQSQDENHLGIPSLSVFSLGARSAFNPQGSWGHLGFSPVIPMTGDAVLESQRVLNGVLRDMGVATVFNTAPQTYHERSYVILIGFSLDRDKEKNRQVRETYKELVRVAAEHGWGEYRCHTAFMDECAETYSFNNHALLRLQETIKDAIDPKGILSAGRYGIWPQHLRGNRGGQDDA